MNNPLVGPRMAIAAASMLFNNNPPSIFDEYEVGRKPRRPAPRIQRPIPNDIGPVIDTTPESKRARRRRLAKGGDHG